MIQGGNPRGGSIQFECSILMAIHTNGVYISLIPN